MKKRDQKQAEKAPRRQEAHEEALSEEQLEDVSGGAARMQCQNNLKQIGIA